MRVVVVTDRPPDLGSGCSTLESLLALVAAGDEAALGSLYDATSARVYGLALRILGRREPAEEVTLDVYTQVWHQAASFDASRGNAETWLRTLTRSRAIDWLRSQARHRTRREPLDAAAAFKDPGPGPEATALGSEKARRVRLALEKLPAPQREAIAVAYFQGLSYSEAAEALRQPVGTIKTRIRAGLAALRDALAAERETLA